MRTCSTCWHNFRSRTALSVVGYGQSIVYVHVHKHTNTNTPHTQRNHLQCERARHCPTRRHKWCVQCVTNTMCERNARATTLRTTAQQSVDELRAQNHTSCCIIQTSWLHDVTVESLCTSHAHPAPALVDVTTRAVVSKSRPVAQPTDTSKRSYSYYHLYWARRCGTRHTHERWKTQQ